MNQQSTYITKPNNMEIEGWKYEVLKLLFANKADLAFQYKTPFIPTSLFRYRNFSPENISNIKKSQEWLSKPKDFNDFFDSCFNISEDYLYNSLTEAALREKLDNNIEQQLSFINIFRNTNGASEMFFKEFVINSYRDKDKFVCCFSERIDSILMWAHYSNNHTGFCIEYDFSISNYSNTLFPVFYADIPLSKITNSSDSSSAANSYPTLFKDSDWSYEHEWRLIYHDLLIHNSNSQLLNMPKPTGVYLGASISLEDQNLMKSVTLRLNIPLYKMKPNYLNRKLDFYTVP